MLSSQIQLTYATPPILYILVLYLKHCIFCDFFFASDFAPVCAKVEELCIELLAFVKM